MKTYEVLKCFRFKTTFVVEFYLIDDDDDDQHHLIAAI